MAYSEYSQPTEVQNAIKAIFQEHTKQTEIDLLGFTQEEVDIRLISDEGQQAVLSQLDGSAIKALVPLEGVQSGVLPEVQVLREMLGSSKHLDDIEGASLTELTDVVEISDYAVEEMDLSGATSSTSPWEATRVLTGLSLTSFLAVYTFISVAAVLYAFYLIRSFLPQDQGQVEKRSLSHVDVESGYVYQEGVITQEKTPDLGVVTALEPSQASRPPIGVLVDIDTEVSLTDDEFHGAIDNSSRTSTPRALPSELPPAIEKAWLVPLPPSPSPSPLLRTIQLHEGIPMEGDSRPAWALVASDEQPRADTPTGDATTAIDLALAMQLRTGLGVTADAAWLMRFVMALFGWVAVLVGGGGERQARGGRRLLGW
ncbi:hypothetical protein B0F90DRAFT_611919 [Multifurca ochricompacta]|uniref:Uncharacterized protein n=1 Tax=Multifurca ochricompacta TaxID=376703 RepID=A0AAD4M2E8_9AGAM|nr:hypothetical protein B0F90DRAFT_611919 [Multifurca ochricompacta]